MSNPTCFVDVDGILADYNKGICNLFGFENPYLKENFECYNKEIIDLLPDKYKHINKQQFYENQDFTFWIFLQFTNDARLILQILEEKFGQENICLLTAPILTSGCLDGKRAWIDTNLPKYRNQYLIGPTKRFCAKGNLLIDDREKNCKEFVENGGKAFLYPRFWNAEFLNAERSHYLLMEYLKDF